MTLEPPGGTLGRVTNETFDLFRSVALVAAALNIAVSGVIGVLYFHLYRAHVAALTEGRVEAWRGMLPRHVATIALSYIGLTLYAMFDVAARLRTEPTWRAGVLLACSAVGLWAMWEILGHARYRTRDLKQVKR